MRKSSHYVCIVDEMNLARVEYYFAEVLSRMEDRKQWNRAGYGSGPLLSLDLRDENLHWGKQRLPPNLAIVGTVNMDETTHSFSRKVLDRAFTLEFSDIDLTLWGPSPHQDSLEPATWPVEAWYPRATRISELVALAAEERSTVESVIDVFSQVNTMLAQAQLQVGYRTRDEAALFVLHAGEISSSFVTRKGTEVDPLDLVLHMKILPRIVGGSNAIRRLLLELLGWAKNGTPFHDEEDANSALDDWARADRPSMLSGALYPQTAARLCLMWDRLRSEGFTSFWL
jgi:5-methylcytosine-specific restriction protein B